MQYRELVKTVQDYSGFSDSEADEALRVFIETLSARLEGGEREDFASQLPSELKDLALSVTETINFNRNDLYQTVSELQEIEEPHARKQVKAVWSALKDALSEGQINDIRDQLPQDLADELA